MKYLEGMQKWNRTYNLTAIDETDLMVSHHLLDSLAVLPHLKLGRWLDVGAGAGLPGIVMAIVQPDWHIDMIDSNSKKCSFVQQSIIELGIKNAAVICARVESWSPPEKYHGIISRAYAEIEKFVSTTRHLLLPGGRWVAMKGDRLERELQLLPEDVFLETVIPLSVPGLNAARYLAIMKQK